MNSGQQAKLFRRVYFSGPFRRRLGGGRRLKFLLSKLGRRPVTHWAHTVRNTNHEIGVSITRASHLYLNEKKTRTGAPYIQRGALRLPHTVTKNSCSLHLYMAFRNRATVSQTCRQTSPNNANNTVTDPVSATTSRSTHPRKRPARSRTGAYLSHRSTAAKSSDGKATAPQSPAALDVHGRGIRFRGNVRVSKPQSLADK